MLLVIPDSKPKWTYFPPLNGIILSSVALGVSISVRTEIITKEVIKRLENAGLILNPEKCKLPKQMKFLEHMPTQHGILQDPEKVRTISSVKIHTRVKEL